MHIQAIEVAQIEASILLQSRTLPATLKVCYFLAFIVFGGYCLWDLWPHMQGSKGSWLPFDALSNAIKSFIIYTCIGITFLICLVALVREMKILLLGKNWELDEL